MTIWDQFFQKWYFPSKTEKGNIIIIWLSFCTKFYLKQILIFEPNFPKKGFSGLKQKSEHKDSIRSNYTRCQKSAYTSNFDFSRPNLPKQGISSISQKMLTSPLNFKYSSKNRYLITACMGNFNFLTNFSRLKQKKGTSPLISAYSKWPRYQVSA